MEQLVRLYKKIPNHSSFSHYLFAPLSETHFFSILRYFTSFDSSE